MGIMTTAQEIEATRLWLLRGDPECHDAYWLLRTGLVHPDRRKAEPPPPRHELPGLVTVNVKESSEYVGAPCRTRAWLRRVIPDDWEWWDNIVRTVEESR